MRQLLFVLLFPLAIANVRAFAGECETQANAAYNQTLKSCQVTPLPIKCTANADCSIGLVCRAGSCVSPPIVPPIPPKPPINCVPRCVSRYDSGGCNHYGNDFCGANAGCTSNCVNRYDDGRCNHYGSDVCAEGGASCFANCISRYDNGTCNHYGPDICD